VRGKAVRQLIAVVLGQRHFGHTPCVSTLPHPPPPHPPQTPPTPSSTTSLTPVWQLLARDMCDAEGCAWQ
jgi:hypothetical protein